MNKISFPSIYTILTTMQSGIYLLASQVARVASAAQKVFSDFLFPPDSQKKPAELSVSDAASLEVTYPSPKGLQGISMPLLCILRALAKCEKNDLNPEELQSILREEIGNPTEQEIVVENSLTDYLKRGGWQLRSTKTHHLEEVPENDWACVSCSLNISAESEESQIAEECLSHFQELAREQATALLVRHFSNQEEYYGISAKPKGLWMIYLDAPAEDVTRHIQNSEEKKTSSSYLFCLKAIKRNSPQELVDWLLQHRFKVDPTSSLRLVKITPNVP
jgi:hypothetical protein